MNSRASMEKKKNNQRCRINRLTKVKRARAKLNFVCLVFRLLKSLIKKFYSQSH